MTRKIYLLGGGGHGRVVLGALLASQLQVSGILDPKFELGHQIFGVSILGGNEFLESLSQQDVILLNGLGANPDTKNRKKIFKLMQLKGFQFISVQHPSSVIGQDCELGEGTQIMAGVVVQNQVKMGDNSVINTHASIDHDCIIDAHVFISPGVVLCGNVAVGDSAFIGAGAIVLPGIQIGSSAIVGAGAVVTKSVPERWIVAGNPAKKIGVRNHG